jgi:hypothetical protein
MGQTDVKLLERYKIVGIVLFILFVVITGILLIAYASWAKLDSSSSIIFTSLGGTLIAVGLVDLLSEAFIRPGTVGTMKEMLNQFISEPSKLPKSLRTALVRAFVEALSPTDVLCPEVALLFDETFLNQLATTYRSDCVISLRLRKKTISGQVVAEGTTDVSYHVHNLTDHTFKYAIPFAFNTVSFTDKGIAAAEHIKLSRISVTDSKGASIDVGNSVGAYGIVPTVHTIFPSKVELSLPQSPTFDIEPHGSITVLLKYVYLAQLIDDHVHKMKELTRNINFNIDFLTNEFVVDIDTFCIPKMNTIDPNKRYSWAGWFIPYHGFCVAWHPA